MDSEWAQQDNTIENNGNENPRGLISPDTRRSRNKQNGNDNIFLVLDEETSKVYHRCNEMETMMQCLGFVCDDKQTKEKEDIERLARIILITREQMVFRQKRIGILQTHPAKKNPYSKEMGMLKHDEASLSFEKGFLDAINQEFITKLHSYLEYLEKRTSVVFPTQSQTSTSCDSKGNDKS